MSTSDSKADPPQPIAGYYYDGRRSVRVAVRVLITGERIEVEGAAEPRSALLRDVEISHRIGNTPRILRFADGASCEVADNDAIDAALEAAGAHQLARHVSQFERNWPWAVAALLLVVVVCWAGITYGIPALANRAARVVPIEKERWLGEKVLIELDDDWLKPSGLPPARKVELQSYFRAMCASLGPERGYRLELRAGGRLKANAFALPGGIVVMTDELVELAERDTEIEAVLAHELGHVVGRHSLRSILQNSATAALVVAMTGDVSTIVAATPTLLLHAKYSRDFERDADAFAFRWLDSQGIARSNFASMLERLEKKYGDVDFGYLSSHPKTTERINGARR